MASASLYPPIVETYAAAFTVDDSVCRIPFSLSKISTSNIKSIHISVIKQSSGISVINNTSDGVGRYRSAGILILNVEDIGKNEEHLHSDPDKQNLYYVDILKEDIKGGWTKGWIYKIQIRLSSVAYDGSKGQATWLNDNASNFSEWSTYCTTKAIGKRTITLPILNNYNSEIDLTDGSNETKNYVLSLSSMDFTGTYSNEDQSETLYSYELSLYDKQNNLIEESGVLYTNQYYNPNQFKYLFKHEFEDKEEGTICLSYSTINKFEEILEFNFTISQVLTQSTTLRAITSEYLNVVKDEKFRKEFENATSIESENEEGRIGIRVYADNRDLYSGNICVRRSDSRDNFTIWTTVKIINCVNEVINDLPIFFDYTVESGVWYRYGVQIIDRQGNKGIINPQKNACIREFEYSYLLGEGGRQLKLNLSNSISSYSYFYSEGKTDTIGGQYPFIARNGNTKYRTFPLACKISYNMDDQNTFTSDKEIYKYDEIIDKYKTHRKEENFGIYDYKLEYDFREKVLAFLQDGKPKLFKSATEGNIIISLMNVTESPEESLNRMIGTFNSQANEVADSTMENYIKYGLIDIGEWAKEFKVYNTKIGQLELDFSIGDNIIEKIYNKYNHSNENVAGRTISVKNIHNLSLEFTDNPLLVKNNSNEKVMGNNIQYGENKIITVYGGKIRYYSFGSDIKFYKGDSLKVLGGLENEPNQTIHIIVNFLYDVEEEPYVEKEMEMLESIKGVGQIYNRYTPGADIYNEIYYKFYFNDKYSFIRLDRLSWACIETNPGAVFEIILNPDILDPTKENITHEVNQTGVLNLEDLGIITGIKYVGMRDKNTGEVDETVSCDILIDYIYYLAKGTYKEV